MHGQVGVVERRYVGARGHDRTGTIDPVLAMPVGANVKHVERTGLVTEARSDAYEVTGGLSETTGASHGDRRLVHIQGAVPGACKPNGLRSNGA